MSLSSGNFGIIVAASLAGLLIGFDAGAGSATILALREAMPMDFMLYHMSAWRWGPIVGGLAGAIAAGLIGDAVGARGVLRLVGILFAVSALGIAVCQGANSFGAANFVGAVAVGAAIVAGPAYLVEAAPTARRGACVMLFALNIPLGLLLGYLYAFVAQSLVQGADAWRWMAGFASLPAVVFFARMLRVPQSPRGLAVRGSVDHARTSLFDARHRRQVVLALVLAVFGPLMGGMIVSGLSADALYAAGFSAEQLPFVRIVFTVANALAIALAMFAVDRVGRRPLLLGAAVVLTLCLGLLVLMEGHLLREYMLAVVLVFGVALAVSQHAVVYLYSSEILPGAVRLRGLALMGVIQAVFFALTMIAGRLMRSDEAMLGFFALCMVVYFFVLRAKLRETRGVELESVPTAFVEKRDVWRAP